MTHRTLPAAGLARRFAGPLLGAGLLLAPLAALAGPIPTGWTAIGNAGSGTPNGVVTAPPVGGPGYQYVTTDGGAIGGGTLGAGFGSETDGSTLTTSTFAAEAGDTLEFYFNYVTSDGSGFADYAWARLIDTLANEIAILFTARTQPAPGNIVPGFGLPPAAATLTPASIGIQAGTTWSELGGSSGGCFSSGCGHSGWIQSVYTIGAAGSYQLQFGVTNWSDQAFDSGMAIAGTTIEGVPIDDNPVPVPAPAALGLFGMGLAGLMVARRRRPAA